MLKQLSEAARIELLATIHLAISELRTAGRRLQEIEGLSGHDYSTIRHFLEDISRDHPLAQDKLDVFLQRLNDWNARVTVPDNDFSDETQLSFVYPTREEAKAFKEGVEYVNDSALTVSEVKQTANGYGVTIHDEDGTPASTDASDTSHQ